MNQNGKTRFTSWLAKVNDRIQIQRLARSRNKRHRNMNRERWV